MIYSFSEIWVSICGKQEEFNIDKFIMMGDMFSNSVLYSRVLSKFQLSNPYFSKAIALS
jgi:hypothetical protein